jgi:ABC-type polysaccharide/polyol phosphate export permease
MISEKILSGSSSIKIDDFKMEYETLRDEIIKRVELRQQLLSITLGFAGAFLGVAVSFPTTPSVALIYPPIALFLAIG